MQMGSCLSLDYDPVPLPTAKVISVNGILREYSIPITVSQVIEMDISSCFLCDSDRLYYDEYITALDHKENLQEGQIYFILPMNRLQYRVTASDMAALAVRANAALVQSSKKRGRGRRKIQISPVLKVNLRVGSGGFDGYKRIQKQPSIGISRSGSVRKLHTSASRRAKLAVRSFRERLTTIFEGTVAE